MLSRKNRISRKVFSELLLNSKYINSPEFSLRYVVGGTVSRPQIGVSVSKKISKSAVVRNTIRRRTYSVMDEAVQELSRGLYLFVAKPGSEKLKGKKLKDEIKKLVLKLNQ